MLGLLGGLPFLLLLELPLGLLVLDGIDNQCDWAVTHNFHVHILSESAWLHSVGVIHLLQIVKKGVKKGQCLVAVHGVVEVRLGAFELVVEGELGDEEDLEGVVDEVAVPGLARLVRPQLQL